MRITSILLFACTLWMATSAPAPAHGQEPPGGGSSRAAEEPGAGDQTAPQTIALTVAPAPEPRPALKYRLFASPQERKPGNAAQYYYRAILLLKQVPQEGRQEDDSRRERWLEAEPKDFPKEDVAKWLSQKRAALGELKVATSREYCDWDFRVQDLRGMETISFLLAEIQDSRNLARILQLKARSETIDGKYGEALETLRQGYQLAHDMARPPFLVCALVGIAIENVMDAELLRLIEHSNANYYWALASLPQPLVDLGPAMQFEMNMPQQLFPFLKDAETVQRTPDEWRKIMIDTLRGLEGLSSSPAPFSNWQGELATAALVAKLYSVAKQELIAGGLDKERVESMPVGQVVAIQTARSVEYAFHEVFKLSLLANDESQRRMPEVLKKLEGEGHLRPPNVGAAGGLPIANLLLPAVGSVHMAEVRAARNRAVLLAIEAIRMHAAAAEGKLPATLAEVTIVPVPINPATGQPFPYQLDAARGTATLDVPPVGGLTPRQDAKRYVIRLR